MAKDVFYFMASLWLVLLSLSAALVPGSENYKPYLLEEITINNETYLIVDYNIIKDTFTLESGVKINKNVVYQLIEK